MAVKLPLKKRHITYVALSIMCVGLVYGTVVVLKSFYPIRKIIIDNHIDELLAAERRVQLDPSDQDAALIILNNLTNSDPVIVTSTIRTLGRIDSEFVQEVQVLSKYLSHANPQFRRDAMLAINDRDDAVLVIDDIIIALGDPELIDVPVIAAESLSEMGADAQAALPALREARDDPSKASFRKEYEKAIAKIKKAISDEDLNSSE